MDFSKEQIIHTVRSFNRFYTNVLGLLDKNFLDSDYSLAEARVLFEIGSSENCTSKELIRKLRIDPGYLSRILKSFEVNELIYRVQSENDGRIYNLFLTEKGSATLSDLEGLSDFQIKQVIGCLSEQEQLVIVDSMETISKSLSGNPELTEGMIRIRNDLKPGDVGSLINLHGWIYAEECGYNHIFEGYVCKTFYNFYEKYSPEKDRIWFAEVNGKMIGAIAIVGHTPIKAQLRWFILHPAYRGLGMGRKLLDEAMRYCREKAYKDIFLETTEDQKAAIGMYMKAGFRKTAEHESSLWGKKLVEQTYELHLP